MATKTETAEATERLREILSPGDVVRTKLDHVSRSGMTRWIDLYVIRDNEPVRITRSAADVTGYTYDRRRDALKIEGCGMDMGFAAVYSLSLRLFPDGFGCIGDDCPSNDHSNGDRDWTPHGSLAETNPRSPRFGGARHWHQSGGYALQQRWL